MTNFNHMNLTGNTHHLVRHFGNPDNTLVAGEHYIIPDRPETMTGLRYPDLLISFGVNPRDYVASNGYIIPERGKPPDFVLEVASESTAENDTGPKREDYAVLGIPEYWLFDETGEHHGARLAGDRLVEGGYEPIPITETDNGALQGYSAVLNLLIRWDNGQLRWRDSETNGEVPTFEQEREARIRAEARVSELEAELERRSGGEERPPAGH